MGGCVDVDEGKNSKQKRLGIFCTNNDVKQASLNYSNHTNTQ